jgi:hypothetical protein
MTAQLTWNVRTVRAGRPCVRTSEAQSLLNNGALRARRCYASPAASSHRRCHGLPRLLAASACTADTRCMQYTIRGRSFSCRSSSSRPASGVLLMETARMWKARSLRDAGRPGEQRRPYNPNAVSVRRDRRASGAVDRFRRHDGIHSACAPGGRNANLRPPSKRRATLAAAICPADQNLSSPFCCRRPRWSTSNRRRRSNTLGECDRARDETVIDERIPSAAWARRFVGHGNDECTGRRRGPSTEYLWPFGPSFRPSCSNEAKPLRVLFS